MAVEVKTQQHFTKQNNISQNTTFPKTKQNFRKHFIISQHTTTEEKRKHNHITDYGEGKYNTCFLLDRNQQNKIISCFYHVLLSCVPAQILNRIGKNGRQDGNNKGIF